MRTEKIWSEKIRNKIINRLLTPRQAVVLKDCSLPDVTDLHDVYIYGDTNTGKTILATAILLEHEKRAYLAGLVLNSLFVNVEDMLGEIKSSFDNSSGTTTAEVLKKYMQADVLILDDFGLIKPTDWVYLKLYQIINHRWEYMKTTIYTSNHSLVEVEKIFADNRITSRIQRQCVIIKKKPFNQKS